MNTHKRLIKLKKEFLLNSTIVGQIDDKFIASVVQTDKRSRMIILFDQHAVHERILLEDLITQLQNCKSLASYPLKKVHTISLSADLLTLIDHNRTEIAKLGISFNIDIKENYLRLRGAPEIIIKDGILTVPVREVIHVIKSLLTGLHDSTSTARPIHLGWMKALQTKACHGALRFGDILTREECHDLIDSLSNCDLPFQCAHGRPSAFPAICFETDRTSNEFYNKPNYKKLRNYFEL